MIDKLPDTPWHIGFAKKDEDDPRRHKARCVKYYDGQCSFGDKKCIGSSHCDFYAETEEQLVEILKSRRTIEQEEADRIKTYKAQLSKKIKCYQENFDKPQKYVLVEKLLSCPVCGTNLRGTKGQYAITCSYCKAVFCNEASLEKVTEPVIIVGRKRQNQTEIKSSSETVYLVKKAKGKKGKHIID